MKQLTILMMSILIGTAAWCQGEEVAIMKPINNLFEGMNKGDSALVHTAFTDGVTFATIGLDKEGNPRFHAGELKGFLTAMGKPRKEVYSEPIWDVKIEIDGNFAQVWAKYAFYIDKDFHHCGVDAFHLFKGKEGWKIFHLADTRQQEGCEIPNAIKDRYK